jgi:hypothetical protein
MLQYLREFVSCFSLGQCFHVCNCFWFFENSHAISSPIAWDGICLFMPSSFKVVHGKIFMKNIILFMLLFYLDSRMTSENQYPYFTLTSSLDWTSCYTISTPALYLGDTRFKSRLRNRLPWVRFLWFTAVPQGRCCDSSLNEAMTISVYILSNSLFASHTTTLYNWETDFVVHILRIVK